VDLPYGDGVNETLDVFRAANSNAPVLVFIHGGYWRSLDKSDHSFIARSFTDRGVCVVVPNYALCPGTVEQPVTIPDIAMQMVKALAWTSRHVAEHGGDPARITVAGHSAGGHLAAMMLACHWGALGLPARTARNALSISGLFDLRPLMFTPSLQGALRLTEEDVRRASPALWPAPASGELYSVVGGNESKEFLRHNTLIRDAWGPRAVPVCEELPGLDHFSIVDALAEPGHRLHRLAMELLQAT
jgi:arylformamidase